MYSTQWQLLACYSRLGYYWAPLPSKTFLGESEEQKRDRYLREDLQRKKEEAQRKKEEEKRKKEEAQRKKEEEKRKTRNRAERKCRLANGQEMMLYHQTNETAAKEIRKTGRMLRGAAGMAGGGIYFATTKTDTVGKAKQYRYMVHASVKVGRVKTLATNGDSSITFQSLLNEGYDSVRIPRTNGDEYVVYNYDQVEVNLVKKKKRRSKW